MTGVRTALVMLIGAFTGFLGGMFGKGGSAIATPLLHLVGISSFASLASPLPATIPSTLIAAYAYHRADQVDRAVLRTTIVFGVPATVIGAVATQWIGGASLILVTDIIVGVLGIRILADHHARTPAPAPAPVAALATGGGVGLGKTATDAGTTGYDPTTVAAVALAVGLVSGLLGNSGGFLLAPLFVTVLHIPLKRALGTSLAAAAVLAVPGTIVHAALGHIDWHVTLVFGLASIPLSFFGARLALKTRTDHLELVYGAALVLLGGGLLLIR